MKIAVWHNLPSGGGKRALYDQVRGLRDRGHHVESWCLSTADSAYLSLRTLITEHVVPYEPVPANRPLAQRLGRLADRLLDVPGRPSAMAEACRRCAEEIAAGSFDVLLAHADQSFHAPGIGPALAAITPAVPRVLYLQEPLRQLHEAYPEWSWAAPPPSPWGAGKARASVLRLRDAIRVHHDRITARTELMNARAFPTILVNSIFSRESIARAYGLDSRVCYLGINDELFHPSAGGNASPQGNFLIAVGEFAGRKRPDLAVRALALLPPPRPPLVWVANRTDSATQREVAALAGALGVALDVRVNQPDSELVRLLGEARLMVYTPRLEPFGYAPLEANACGTPVVGVAEGGVRETIRDGVNGLLCEPDPAALAEGIARLLNDPSALVRMRAEAPAYVRREWSQERALDRLEAELRRALVTNSPALSV